jgi:hypothetical protein
MSICSALPRGNAQQKSHPIYHQPISKVCICLIHKKKSSSMQARLHAYLLTQIIKSTFPSGLCKQFGSIFFTWDIIQCHILSGNTLSNTMKAKPISGRNFHNSSASLIILDKAMYSALQDDRAIRSCPMILQLGLCL